MPIKNFLKGLHCNLILIVLVVRHISALNFAACAAARGARWGGERERERKKRMCFIVDCRKG